jgi:NAD(P)-dependent dehydrogenase (short-subunit alcohol dehydrogenase family)
MSMIVIPQAPRTALVTGAASGLGAAVCARLQDDGWQVAGLDRVPCPGLEHAAVADVTSAGELHDAVDGLVSALGGLGAVAACAGVFRNTLAPVHLLPPADWDSTVGVNLTGSFHLLQAVLPHLLAAGGSIVLTASVAAHYPQPGGAAYGASKAGLTALARAVALEYAGHGVRCNSVLPGYMRTAMTQALLRRDDLRARIEAAIPAGRVAAPAEVADVIAFLLGGQAGYVTGQEIVIDGGASLTSFTDQRDVPRMWRRAGLPG